LAIQYQKKHYEVENNLIIKKKWQRPHKGSLCQYSKHQTGF
jgi:hypothetical protein